MKIAIKNKGITLVELLVTSLIGVIVMSGITSIIYVSSSMSNRIIDRTKVNSVLSLSSTILQRNIRLGRNVDFFNITSDSSYTDLAIFNPDNNDSLQFAKGYSFSNENSNSSAIIDLMSTDLDGNNISNLVPFYNIDFSGSSFSKVSDDFVYFELKVSLLDNKGNVKLSSGILPYYTKCRN